MVQRTNRRVNVRRLKLPTASIFSLCRLHNVCESNLRKQAELTTGHLFQNSEKRTLGGRQQSILRFISNSVGCRLSKWTATAQFDDDCRDQPQPDQNDKKNQWKK